MKTLEQSEIERLTAALSAEQAAREAAEAATGNLLARIFRDGGQHQATYPSLREACDAAEALCVIYMHNAESAEQSARQQIAGWIAVSERLPDSGIPVLAFYKNSLGKGRRIRAFYAPPKTIEDDNEYEAAEYDEASDNYFLREGWYENNEHDEVNWFVDEPVTYWQPLPPPPGQDTALPKTSEPHSPNAVAVALERAAGICDRRVKAMEQTNGWHSRGPYTMGAYNEAVCLALSIRALIPSPDTQQDHVAGASPDSRSAA